MSDAPAAALRLRDKAAEAGWTTALVGGDSTRLELRCSDTWAVALWERGKFAFALMRNVPRRNTDPLVIPWRISSRELHALVAGQVTT